MLEPVHPKELDDHIPPPWETLFPKQIEVFNVQQDSENRHPECPGILLVDGSREAGKTISVGHLVCRHLWETPSARAALIVKITGSATDGGVWLDLVEEDGIVDQWCNARIEGAEEDFIFDYTTRNKEGKPGPIADGKTRTIYFRIRNYWGGESELRLISLQHEHEVASRFKSTRFSLMWFSELSNFKDPNVFTLSWEQLRMQHLPKHRHIWVGDTNPAEEGEDSWIYKQFIERQVSEELQQALEADTDARDQYYASMKRIHFKMDDNPTLSDVQKAIKRAHYAHDPGEMARNCDGEWTKGHGNAGKHFADLFMPSIHIIGDSDESIELHPDTDSLFTGWDIGSSSWHAMGVIEKRMLMDPATNLEFSVFSIIDEIFSDHEEKAVGEFGVEMLEIMSQLEDQYQKKFAWKHWADDSALNVFRASSATYDYMEIQAATGGAINLDGVPKPDGSVATRVRLIRKLLKEERLFVSGKCKSCIKMFEECKRGTPPGEGSATRGSRYVLWNESKHVFDWVSYVLFMECGAELFSASRRPSKTRSSEIISHRLA